MEYNIEYTRNKIKSLIKQKEISQKILAEELHISQSTLSKWLSNTEFSVETLVAIANYFQVTVDELIYDEEASNMQKVDISFASVIGLLAEFAKEYGLTVECKTDTEDRYEDYGQTMNRHNSSIKFSYISYLNGICPNDCERKALANHYICDFLKEFSSVLNIHADNEKTYNEIIDLWIKNKIEDAKDKYDDYLEAKNGTMLHMFRENGV